MFTLSLDKYTAGTIANSLLSGQNVPMMAMTRTGLSAPIMVTTLTSLSDQNVPMMAMTRTGLSGRTAQTCLMMKAKQPKSKPCLQIFKR